MHVPKPPRLSESREVRKIINDSGRDKVIAYGCIADDFGFRKVIK